MKAAEEAIRRYCPAELVAEFDEMDLATQETLIEALMSGYRSRIVHAIVEDTNEHGQSYLKGLSPADPMCPFTRACQEHNMNSEMLFAKHLSPLRDALSSWGSIPRHPAFKIAKYKHIVAMQKQGYAKNPNGVRDTSAAVIKRSSTTANWSSLKQIRFQDLSLFKTSKGCFVEGTIVGEAIQPIVGGTTLIQEKEGDVLLVCFYNLLPDGMNGKAAEELLKVELPMGATLRVAEPFFKIFGDGQRGVRVDNPNEMEVFSKQGKVVDVIYAKKQGNDFVAKKRYNAAIDSYLSGIRHSTDMVPTILSNRCQAFIKLEKWGPAFCDAAASLTIRPESPKTWARYKLCLEKLESEIGSKEKTKVWNLLAGAIATESPTAKTVDVSGAEGIKAEGNKFFQKDSYEDAIESYTKALAACGEIIRAMLSNWAFCALQMHIFGDVIASAAASLRIGNDEKAIYRLAKALSLVGEYSLSIRVLSQALSSKNIDNLHKDVQRAQTFTGMMIEGIAEDPFVLQSMLVSTPKSLGNWHGAVETFITPDGKGRGVRATKDLDAGSVVLVEWPLVSAKADSSVDGGFLFMGTSDNKLHDVSSSKLRPLVMNRLKRDLVLGNVLSCLSDGSKTDALVPFSGLLVNLEMYRLMLPTHREYFFNDEFKEIPAARVNKILSTNTHGKSWKGDGSSTTELYPALSMMNHASQPNCAFGPCTEEMLVIVLTCQKVKAGDELFMKYHNEDVVARHWGI